MIVPTRLAGDDRGAVVVLVAALMGALIVMVATVLDLSGARRDREADQVAADAMALAAAANLSGSRTTAEVACESVWEYLVVNLPTAETAPATSPCDTAFDGACTSANENVARSTTPAEIGAYTVTFTHPVPDGHALVADRAVTTVDGKPCDRFGVRVQQERANLWAAGSVDLDVDAVGRHIGGVGNVDAPLILLEPHGCEVLTVSGTADLTVGGAIAIDSDATSGCSGNKVVVFEASGTGVVSAEEIAMWALQHSADTVAVSNNAQVSPDPTPAAGPVGANAVVWRYNCDPAAGCPYDGPPHIDELEAAYSSGTPSVLKPWSSSYPCTVTTNTVVDKPAGYDGWYVNCTPLKINSGVTLTFAGGDAVLTGNLDASGSGHLRFNCPGAPTPADACGDPASGAVLLARTGNPLAGGNLELRETMVHSSAPTMDLSGAASITWTAPMDGRFEDLLLWAESTTQMKITGSSSLSLEGIVYVPNASIELAGTSDAQALGAQLFARTAKVTGNGTFNLQPDEQRMVPVGKGRVLLIR